MNAIEEESGRGAERLRARLCEVRARVEDSARRAGRAPDEVTLIAVSKTHPAAVVEQALSAGAIHFGENRVQEAEGKIAEIESGTGGGKARALWHLIGHLQSNKARRAVKLFDFVQTVDTVALVERLERACAEEGRAALPVLAQVSLAGEEAKTGAVVTELPAIVEAIKRCAHLRLAGLMTIPPFDEEAEAARPFFRRLRGLRDVWRERGAFDHADGTGAGELSMGISYDFEVAIEEGATMVRVGTAIFGARSSRG